MPCAYGVISNRGKFKRGQLISGLLFHPLRFHPLHGRGRTTSAASPDAVWTLRPLGAPIRCRAGCADTAVILLRSCRYCSNFPPFSFGCSTRMVRVVLHTEN